MTAPSTWLPPPSKGRTGGRHRMRCSKPDCQKRFTLKRHPDAFKRSVRCPACRSLNVYSCEASRRRELARQNTCRCDGYPFPHRSGSLRFCVHNALAADLDPTVEEIHAYQGIIATRRSAFC